MTPEISYSASHRFARTSSRKVQPVLNLIRGKYADDAVDILQVEADSRIMVEHSASQRCSPPALVGLVA